MNTMNRISDPSNAELYCDYKDNYEVKEEEVEMMEQLFDDIYVQIKDQLKKVQLYTMEKHQIHLQGEKGEDPSSSSGSDHSKDSNYEMDLQIKTKPANLRLASAEKLEPIVSDPDFFSDPITERQLIENKDRKNKRISAMVPDIEHV